MNKDSFLYKFLNKFELYLASIIFAAIMALLFLQVITRYLLGHAFTWTEEIAIIGFVWMQYLGICASVLSRKQLRIDFFLDLMPFKLKKVILILDNVLTMLFCGIIIPFMLKIIENMIKNFAVTDLLHIPNSVAYAIMPFSMALMIIRLIQESVILAKENEKELGAVKPTLDLDAIEREYLESQAGKEAQG